MLVLLSPAKTLDLSPSPLSTHTQPRLLDDAGVLIQRLRSLSSEDVAELMSLSDSLAELNVQRYHAFAPNQSLENAKQALLTFKGDTYRDMGLEHYTEEDFAFAQAHVRILSGLYGLLRPLDLIQPYRLEMGTRLRTSRGRDLYAFWGERVTDELNAALESQADDVVLNCASDEYVKVVQRERLKGRVVKPVFKDYKSGTYKVISFYAKRARGMMASFVVRGRVDAVAQLRAFDWGGYHYAREGSTDSELLFLRRQA
jgi:uncharacterized protein